MDDYNRTGMLGATDIHNAVTDEEGDFPTKELEDLYNTIHYPRWFIEGTASSVENVYAFRYNMFKMLRAKEGSETTFNDIYDVNSLLYNYLNATSDKKDLYFDLEFSGGYDENGNEVDSDQSRYVSGYLATLYLSELAAKKGGESAIKEDETTVAISSERLRAGLNSILERMHNGETLDQVVNDLSPVDVNGKKLYSDTNDFEAKFIKGVGSETATGTNYSGDEASLQFTTTFLNYLVRKRWDRTRSRTVRSSWTSPRILPAPSTVPRIRILISSRSSSRTKWWNRRFRTKLPLQEAANRRAVPLWVPRTKPRWLPRRCRMVAALRRTRLPMCKQGSLMLRR